MAAENVEIIKLFDKIRDAMKRHGGEISKIIETEDFIQEEYAKTLTESILSYEIPLRDDFDTISENDIILQYIILKKKIEMLSFNELCAAIKSNKGMVGRFVIERAGMAFYNTDGEYIIRSCAKRKNIYFIDSDDIESIKTTVYTAIMKFDIERPPYDMNAAVNKIIENRLMTMIKKRIRKNTIDKKESDIFKQREAESVNSEESIVENYINRELKEILKEEDKKVIMKMSKFYIDKDERNSEFASTVKALGKLAYECRQVFISIMRFVVNDVAYNTKMIIEETGMEKSEDAARQTLRMCRKRLVKEIEIMKGGKNG